MKVVLAEPRYIKESISLISDLVNEAKFKATTDGLELVAMDSANVAMVVFKALSSCFVEYEVKKTEEFAINLASFKQVLRRAKADDVLTLETTDENKFQVGLQGATKRSFSLPTLELDTKEQKVPDLKFPVKISTSATLLSGAIEDVSIVAESVTFLGEKQQLSVKAEGDLSKAFIEIKPDENTQITIDNDDKHKAKYSLEYLKKMIGGSKVADRVTLSFTTDYPLKLEYTEIDRVSLAFILAPRVDND